MKQEDDWLSAPRQLFCRPECPGYTKARPRQKSITETVLKEALRVSKPEEKKAKNELVLTVVERAEMFL